MAIMAADLREFSTPGVVHEQAAEILRLREEMQRLRNAHAAELQRVRDANAATRDILLDANIAQRDTHAAELQRLRDAHAAEAQRVRSSSGERFVEPRYYSRVGDPDATPPRDESGDEDAY